MTTPLVIALPGNEALANSLAARVQGELGQIETRSFPDAETYLRFHSDPTGRAVILVCSLDRPNPKFLPLVFAADAARDLGATKVVLVAPYLCYMRQDRRFHEGEAITSVSFARRLSATVDALVTVDPHLHRYAGLEAIYSIPTHVVGSAPAIAEWIAANEKASVLIGPDSESEQWVGEVARRAGAPFCVLQKERLGDRHVRITLPDLNSFREHLPILIDDIVSSGRTMIEAARQLRQQGLRAPVCVAVHALFSLETEQQLLQVASKIVSTNTVLHASNAIDLTGALSHHLVKALESAGQTLI